MDRYRRRAIHHLTPVSNNKRRHDNVIVLSTAGTDVHWELCSAQYGNAMRRCPRGGQPPPRRGSLLGTRRFFYCARGVLGRAQAELAKRDGTNNLRILQRRLEREEKKRERDEKKKNDDQ